MSINLNFLLGKKITAWQIKSKSKLNPKQKGSLIGIGLSGIGSKSELNCTESVLGMLKKVHHLIKVT